MKVRGIYKYGNRYGCAEDVEIPHSVEAILKKLKYHSVFVEIQPITTYKRYIVSIDFEEENLMHNLQVLERYVPDIRLYFQPILSITFVVVSV